MSSSSSKGGIGGNLRGMGTIQSLTGGKQKANSAKRKIPHTLAAQPYEGYQQLQKPSAQEGGGAGGGGGSKKLRNPETPGTSTQPKCPVCCGPMGRTSEQHNEHLDLCLAGSATTRPATVQPTLESFVTKLPPKPTAAREPRGSHAAEERPQEKSGRSTPEGEDVCSEDTISVEGEYASQPEAPGGGGTAAAEDGGGEKWWGCAVEVPTEGGGGEGGGTAATEDGGGEKWWGCAVEVPTEGVGGGGTAATEDGGGEKWWGCAVEVPTEGGGGGGGGTAATEDGGGEKWWGCAVEVPTEGGRGGGGGTAATGDGGGGGLAATEPGGGPVGVAVGDAAALVPAALSPEKAEPSWRTRGDHLLHLIRTVRGRDGRLLEEGEAATLRQLEAMPAQAVELLARLLQRKGPWFRLDRLTSYREVPAPVEAAVSLAGAGVARLSGGSAGLTAAEAWKGSNPAPWPRARLEDLAERLDVLANQELRQVVVDARAMARGEAASARRDVLLAAPFGSRIGAAALLDRVDRAWSAAAGPCLRVSEGYRALQRRLERLFFLNEGHDVGNFLLSDLGVHRYPAYSVNRVGAVFPSRDALLRYEAALEAAGELEAAVEGGDVGAALAVAESSLDALDAPHCRGLPPAFSDLRDHSPPEAGRAGGEGEVGGAAPGPGAGGGGGGGAAVEGGGELGVAEERSPASRLFLSRFSAEWVHASMATVAVSLLERTREYARAVEVLRSMLGTQYCPGRRGYWWLRLSVDLEHIDRPGEALEVAEAALADEWVRFGDRLSLRRRVLRLGKPPRRWKRPPWADEAMWEPRERRIEGNPLNRQVGYKSRFSAPDGGECGVEELGLLYYADEGRGGWSGAHNEGGAFSTVFGLLLWDALFNPAVPDVFQTPCQDRPLDLATDAFYPSRRRQIDARLAELEGDGGEGGRTPEALLREAWAAHEGTFCVGVNWERHGVDELADIVRCVGGKGLAAVLRLLAADYRNHTGGMPDLLLWHPGRGEARLVEVKGPRDRLSDQQRMWLREMEGAGMDVEVLKVVEA